MIYDTNGDQPETLAKKRHLLLGLANERLTSVKQNPVL
jgi:hypothetical protein